MKKCPMKAWLRFCFLSWCHPVWARDVHQDQTNPCAPPLGRKRAASDPDADTAPPAPGLPHGRREGLGEAATRTPCSMRPEILLRTIRCLHTDRADGRTPRQGAFTPLNGTPKNGQNGQCCVFTYTYSTTKKIR